MGRMRVLVVEDEEMLAEAIAEGLRQQAMAVDVCFDGAAALERVAVNRYDIVVLDRDLPHVHGDQVCQTLVSSHSTTRVIMLTAARNVMERVHGLGIGADDYLTKPFALAELVARVHALGRRAQPALPPVLRWGDIEMNVPRHQVSREDRFIYLSRKEFAVLEVLMRANGSVVSAEELLEQAWDEHIDPFTNAVRVTMVTLRRKLGLPAVIRTLPGVGYQLAG
ncbi:DNA-binding response regulator, OmpR family, contains REC and winged-helix (wHTH) domain [Lentzea waywayandensis]|uniref:DNA-binding response regulator, OmpR family, contains REC and winged-helix (WHTH) domain n=2 Tax=Lentzea waywayandensis TaxID=84724 RepID=A0A1I6DLA3_9PSEU|nr:DNA-binding response regulator, OmpR family, contains REC and winged-helix (wHTH) domain [Lentzea waywayandensis]